MYTGGLAKVQGKEEEGLPTEEGTSSREGKKAVDIASKYHIPMCTDGL